VIHRSLKRICSGGRFPLLVQEGAARATVEHSPLDGARRACRASPHHEEPGPHLLAFGESWSVLSSAVLGGDRPHCSPTADLGEKALREHGVLSSAPGLLRTKSRPRVRSRMHLAGPAQHRRANKVELSHHFPLRRSKGGHSPRKRGHLGPSRRARFTPLRPDRCTRNTRFAS
jgi:hypothetical protein